MNLFSKHTYMHLYTRFIHITPEHLLSLDLFCSAGPQTNAYFALKTCLPLKVFSFSDMIKTFLS